MELDELLQQLKIHYEKLEHPAVYTSEEAASLGIAEKLQATACKNLFLSMKHKAFYLLVFPAAKRPRINQVAKLLHVPHLSFASEAELSDLLHLYPGSVTPLGIIHDTENKVTVILDEALRGKTICAHPNRKTATLALRYEDLLTFIHALDHTVIEVPIPEADP